MKCTRPPVGVALRSVVVRRTPGARPQSRDVRRRSRAVPPATSQLAARMASSGKPEGAFKVATMRLPALCMFLTCATAAVAAEPPRTAAPPQQLAYAYIAFKPDISDYYPADSRALGEQGTVSLVLCYDRDGEPDDVTVVNSSGIDRIDEAAVRWGRAVRISAAIRNGAPKADCVWVPAQFSLERVQEPPDQVEGSIPTPAIIWPSLPPPPWPGKFIPLGREVR